MIGVQDSSQPKKNEVNLALLLTIIAVGAILLLVVGGVLIFTDKLRLPFFGEPEQTQLVDPLDDTADYLNTEQPITRVEKSVLERSQLTPTRTFMQDGVEYTESEAIFTSLQGSTLTATVDAFSRELTVTGNTKYRKVSLYILDEETDSIKGVSHATANRSDLSALQEGDKLRVMYESADGNVAEVIMYPVDR